MISIRITMKASLEEMPPPSLKLPALDDDDAAADGSVIPATTMNCVISSPTCVRLLSKTKPNACGAAPFPMNVEHKRQEAPGGQKQNRYSHADIQITLMPERIETEVGCSLGLADNRITQNHIKKCSESVSTSSTMSSDDPSERSNSFGLVPRGQTVIQHRISSGTSTGATEFAADGTVRNSSESRSNSSALPPTLIDVSPQNATVTNVGVGFTPKPEPKHSQSTPRKKASRPQSCTVAPPPAPMTFVGITLERSESAHTWGLIFVKEKGGHALIVRVITPKSEGPVVKWCQITNTVPNPSVVYRTTMTFNMTLEQYEALIVQNFPPPLDSNKIRQGNPLVTPCLMPGDAILSVNGIPVSAFDAGQLALFIRNHCKRRMIIMAMRHEEVVMKAAQIPMHPPSIIQHQQPPDSKAVTDQSSAVIREAWRCLLTSRGLAQQQHQNNQAKRKFSQPRAKVVKRPKIEYCNVAFQNGDGKPIPYCDNDESDPDDGERIRGFLSDEIEKSFDKWHSSRKSMWRSKRTSNFDSLGICPAKECHDLINEAERANEETTVVHDFWLTNGHASFDTWLSSSKANWARSYSWHHERRNALQSKCTKEVHFPLVTPTDGNNNILEQFENWLSVRKQQWKLERRKRNRLRSEAPRVSLENDSSRTRFAHDMYIDEILKDEEQRLPAEVSQPIDISWVFDVQIGAPDDVIVNIMTFLCPSDHGNLLCLSYTTNFLFKQRNDTWKALFPSHWVVPRRPRKSWCAMYITKIRAEEEASRKRSDDLLIKANIIIQKGDQLNKLEKLVEKATKDFEFSVNYISGVVLERNALLNMAVIDRRHKITKWLIEEKGADIESCDRGQFTPLMNAAWNGDRYATRYLLARGCDRMKVGYNHSSQGLAPPKFEGLTAEGWALKRGHDEVAELIRLGL